nr:transporter [Aeromicrobium sp.]
MIDRASAGIDEHFVEQVRLTRTSEGLEHGTGTAADPRDESVPSARLLAYFDAQLQSRHLDFASRWLRAQDQGFYTIGSAGHESNAAVAMALRPSDPALLHYRSGGFYAARAAQVEGSTPIRDVLLGMAAAAADPISGGRHKVFGHRGLNIIPQTSTIASHLPRAVGLGFAIGRAPAMGLATPWPADSVVVCSFGDASANHSTAVGALNSAAYCAHRGIAVPVLFVCEDNGLGISTKTPPGWLEGSLSRYAGVYYAQADGLDPTQVMAVAQDAADRVRAGRRPAILHLKTVRFMGHAGSDAELGYRTPAEIQRDHARDPLLHTARLLMDRGVLTGPEVLARYEAMRERVMATATAAGASRRLTSAGEIMAPIAPRRADAVARTATALAASRPGDEAPLTLAQSINATLAGVLAAVPEALVFGEDVAVKGGVYGLTRGLRKTFGAVRVFDTLLDEQTIIGTALGTALAGMVPIPEIQYLAYLHNAEDQLRGEAATLGFFSNGQYRNGMVVRVAGLAYQRGFGGHFHNDNSLAVLRDVPGLVLAVPAHPADAPGLLRTCVALAREEGRVCVFVEPIARYHTRDLHAPDDRGWMASLADGSGGGDELGRVTVHGDGGDILVVTFGNGVFLSRRAAKDLAADGIACTVLDLRWLAPLPEAELLAHVGRFDRVLVVDETRRSGGVSESVVSLLVDRGFDGSIARVTGHDSFIPLGAAADHVLLHEDDIIRAAHELTSSPAASSADEDPS